VLVNINEDGEACPHGKTPEDFSEKSSWKWELQYF
jgi:hypothetical protein